MPCFVHNYYDPHIHVTSSNHLCTEYACPCYMYKRYLYQIQVCQACFPTGSLKAIPRCLPANFDVSRLPIAFIPSQLVFLHDLLISQMFCLFPREGSMHFLWSFCRCGSHGSFPSLCQKSSVFVGLCNRAEFMSSTRSFSFHAVLYRSSTN